MTRKLWALALGAALVLLPSTGFPQGSAAIDPLNSVERFALNTSREMLD